MKLEDKELLMLQKLGFEVNKDGNIVKSDSKEITEENLKYAGFNIYISPDNRVFEKQGEELVEVDSPELRAERRFLENNLK